jgi:hypothetical protein
MAALYTESILTTLGQIAIIVGIILEIYSFAPVSFKFPLPLSETHLSEIEFRQVTGNCIFVLGFLHIEPRNLVLRN